MMERFVTDYPKLWCGRGPRPGARPRRSASGIGRQTTVTMVNGTSHSAWRESSTADDEEQHVQPPVQRTHMMFARPRRAPADRCPRRARYFEAGSGDQRAESAGCRRRWRARDRRGTACSRARPYWGVRGVLVCVGLGLIAQPAHPDEQGKRAEEPPLHGVEQVAQRGEPPHLRELVEVGRLQAVGRPGQDRIGAVEVLVDPLDQVGDPQLREYVVVGVLVDGGGPLGGLEPADQLGRPGRRRGCRSGDGTQPRTTGSAGPSSAETASGVTTQ